MQHIAREKLTELGPLTVQNINQRVETLSGAQRQGTAAADRDRPEILSDVRCGLGLVHNGC